MLNKCCLCIDLRTGTQILAVLGIISNLKVAFSVDSVWLTIYCILASLICVFGLVGVLKDNVKMLEVFAFYYWFEVVASFVVTLVFSIVLFLPDVKSICEEMIEKHETDMSMEECISYIGNIRILAVLLLGARSLLELHFCLAVWAYYRNLRVENERIVREEPPSYGALP